jgi:hypothetical protein
MLVQYTNYQFETFVLASENNLEQEKNDQVVKSLGSIALFDRGMPMFTTRTHSFNQSNLVGSVVNDLNSSEKTDSLKQSIL